MRRTLVLSCASLLTLAACSTTKTGTASPSGASVTAPPANAADQVPGPGVPKVETPIDTTRFKQAPCTTLTAAQITELLGSGITPKPDLNAQAGPSCYWHVPNVSQAGVGVVYNKLNNTGLTAIYKKQGTTFPFFMPMDPIDGHPTVAYGLLDERSDGRCAIAVGTSDREMIDVSIAESEANVGKDPCAAAHDVAGKVVDNLRGA